MSDRWRDDNWIGWECRGPFCPHWSHPAGNALCCCICANSALPTGLLEQRDHLYVFPQWQSVLRRRWLDNRGPVYDMICFWTCLRMPVEVLQSRRLGTIGHWPQKNEDFAPIDRI